MASLKAAAYTAILLHAARRITRKLLVPAKKMFNGNDGKSRPYFLYLSDGSKYWPLYLSCRCTARDAFQIESALTYKYMDRFFSLLHEKREFAVLQYADMPTEDPNEMVENLGYAESNDFCDIMISAKDTFKMLTKELQ